MKTFCFVNQKGGVGKTSISTNTAFVFAEKLGARVLFIDNDKQGNASQFFDVDCSIGNSLAELLTGKASIDEVIHHTKYSSLDIIPANIRLWEMNLEVQKDNQVIQQDILKNALQKVEDQYDFCVIDNPPDVNISVVNGMAIADEVIIVTTPSLFGLNGVRDMLTWVDNFKNINPQIHLAGVLINMYCSNSGLVIAKELSKVAKVFQNKIRVTKNHLDLATMHHQSIFEWCPQSGFARDLMKWIRFDLAGGDSE